MCRAEDFIIAAPRIGKVAEGPLSVFLGVQQKVLAGRVMDARRRHFGARKEAWRPRQASLKAMAPEDVSAAAAHVSPEAMARRCGVSRKAATEAVRDADQEVFGAELVPAVCRKLLRAAEAA